MRVRCQFGTIADTTSFVVPQCAPATAVRASRRAARRRAPARRAIAAAVLVAVVGCAAVEPATRSAMQVEPVVKLAHGAQTSDAFYKLGRYHDGAMAWDKSIEAYRTAIAIDPRNVEAHNALGVALARSGRYEDAEATLRQAVAMAPDLAHLRSNLGFLLMLVGKSDEAVRELQAAVRKDSSNATAFRNLRDAMARSDFGLGVGDAARAAAPVSAEAPVATAEPAPTTVLPVAAASVEPAQTPAAAALQTTISVPPPITVADVPGPLPQSVRMPMPLQVAVMPAPHSTVVASSDLPAPAAQVLREELASRLEVSNGNGVTGMAARVGRWLATQGVDTNRLTNQRPFVQQTTVIQYRSGHELAAQRVARSLPAAAHASTAPISGLRSDVRLVLGHDWDQVAACLERSTCQPLGTTLAATAGNR